MPIGNITQSVSVIPAPPHRGVDVQTVFVTKQEDFQDHLAGTTIEELNTLKDQLNTRSGEINSTATTMNGYVDTASAGASTATAKAGEASTSASEALTSRNQASTFATNSSNSATKSSQWADNDYNVAVEAGKYSAKHWSVVAENVVEGTVKLTGNQTVNGVKTFSSNIVGSITGNADTATKLATARTINGVSFDGSANITAPTNLAITDGTTAGPIVTSSTGTNATLPTASGTASGVVTTGNQTIAGVKTFSSNPISTSTQSTAIDALTRKDYVDTKVEKVTSTDNAIVRFDGTTGDVQNSNVIIDDSGNVGIGLTNPHSKLSVQHSASGNTGTNSNTVGSSISIDASDATDPILGLRWTYDRVGIAGMLYTSQIVADNANNNALEMYTIGAKPLVFGTNSTERMGIDASGHLLVGQTSGTSHAISGNNYDTGLPILALGGDGLVNAVAFFAINNQGWSISNAAATAIRVGSSTTGRSINAQGTINASGADYAEYEYSNDITIAKGQIVGFKADGTLTDKYAEAFRFAIKSTNPSIVGGDVWGGENTVGKRPEQPVRKLDKTEQVLIKDSEEFETVVIEAGDTDIEWETIEALYKIELAEFEARLEAERQKVDRIAYAGKVPVNVYGATAGQYIVAIEKDGGIDGLAVNKADMTFVQYQDAVGRVNKILDDGRAEVAVIIH